MRTLINYAILACSVIATAALLWSASHLSFGYSIIAIWLFSLVNNTPFALMHEAVHGIAAKSPRLNYWLGLIAGWTFPTSFLMQRTAHIGHHQRNRTDDELYDYYLPHQSKIVRNIWLYAGNLFGLYWWSVAFSNVVLLLVPWAYRSGFFVRKVAPSLGFGPYVADLVKMPLLQIWLEIAAAFSYQAAIFYLLDLNAVQTFLCYGAFALHWSVLQYADHAWSARDTRSGAWDLQVLPPSRWIALNYHLHRAHHRFPMVPWYQLPEYAESIDLQPSFWRIYFSLWRGVRPAPPMGSPADLSFLFPEHNPSKDAPQK